MSDSNIKEVAKKANVSPSTVSNVLNNTKSVTVETKKRVKKAVNELDYRPDITARGLRGKGTKTIGVIIPSISNPFYPLILRGIEDYLFSEEYSVLLSNTDRNLENELKALKIFSEKKVEGVILTSISLSLTKTKINKNKNKNMKIVALEGRTNLDADKILVDNIYGGFIATKHLLDLGHSRIAFISSPLTRLSRTHRFKGYKKALREKNISLQKSIIKISKEENEIPYNNIEGNYEFENGYKQTMSLLDLPLNKQPTAIFTINDITAIGVMKALNEKEVKIGKDISIVGFDDIPLANFSIPGLTTVAQPKYKMGKLTAKLLLDRIKSDNETDAHKKKKILKPELVIRETTKNI